LWLRNQYWAQIMICVLRLRKHERERGQGHHGGEAGDVAPTPHPQERARALVDAAGEVAIGLGVPIGGDLVDRQPAGRIKGRTMPPPSPPSRQWSQSAREL
jgi:hypothetical protein